MRRGGLKSLRMRRRELKLMRASLENTSTACPGLRSLSSLLYVKGKVECNIYGKVFIRLYKLSIENIASGIKSPTGAQSIYMRRHSVHTLLEMWVYKKNYGKIFGRHKQFKLHLEDLYYKMSPPTKEAKLEDNRQNIPSASSFWCGFYCYIVPFTSDISDPQGIRFDYINDYFIGRCD
ncbi:unnamed protein product [Clonostachys solani]|uniref:Uncharacterized protein n=1 Tax=Clonostachys solani TaxID=160281 RepID=A0A9P0EJW2_9HYPO|nr:unnamed protein product [Clonostachys solani]